MPADASDRVVAAPSTPGGTSGNGKASEGAREVPYSIDAEQSVFDLAGVDVDRRAEVALDMIRAQRRRWARLNRRPFALRPREALQALLHEALVVMVADPASPDDRHRLVVACQRIHAIASEVIRDER